MTWSEPTTLTELVGSLRGAGFQESSEQLENWLELPFVRCNGKWDTDDWAPPVEIPRDDEANGWNEQCIVGRYYGLRFIEHLRKYPQHIHSSLGLVVKAMVERGGEWNGIHVGFFNAIEEYMRDGRVQVSHEFYAVPLG